MSDVDIAASPETFRKMYAVLEHLDNTAEVGDIPTPVMSRISVDSTPAGDVLAGADHLELGAEAVNTSKEERKAMVAVLEVKGMLAKSLPHWPPYMSNTEVLGQMIRMAANDPMVTSIVLVFDSGGGAVNGTALLGDLIADVSKKKKPIYAHIQGTAASAAYWLASQATGIYMSANTDFAGSIGVVTTHVSYEKAYENEGIELTYITPDENDEKVVGPANKALSERDHELIKARLVPMLSEFKAAVKKGRGDRISMDSTGLTSGKVFMGKDAKKMGLVDGIESLEKTILRAYRHGAKYSKDKDKAESFQTNPESDMGILSRMKAGQLTPSQHKAEVDAASAQAQAADQGAPEGAAEEPKEVTLKDLATLMAQQTALLTALVNPQTPQAPTNETPDSADSASADADAETVAKETSTEEISAEQTEEVAAELDGSVSEAADASLEEGAAEEVQEESAAIEVDETEEVAEESAEEIEAAAEEVEEAEEVVEESSDEPSALEALQAQMAQFNIQMQNLQSELRAEQQKTADAEARAKEAEAKAEKAQKAFNQKKKAGKKPSATAITASEGEKAEKSNVSSVKPIDVQASGFSEHFKTNGKALGQGTWKS